jgi:MoaA/NifB/PqqE/SkfB family radical SAM enzyme
VHITADKLKRFATDWRYAGYVVSTQAQRRYHKARARWSGIAPPPKMVILQITGNCNLTCRMCNQWGEDGGYHGIPIKQLTLDLETIEEVLDQVEPYHPYIQLLGGEPPLHPNFYQILESLTRRGLSASLETNGTTLEFWGDKLIGSTVDTLNVSIDGPPEIHDEVRMRKGTYDQALRGVRKVLKLREEAGLDQPRIAIRMTVTPENHEKIVETVEGFRDLPISLFIVQHLLYSHPEILEKNAEMLRPIKPAHEEIKVGGTFKPPDLDGLRVWDQIETVTRPGRYNFPVVANPAYKKEYVRDYYRDASLLPDPGLKCRIPEEVLSISCQGEATICSHFYVGKIADQSLEELWNGQLSRDFRKLLFKQGSIPACKICCYPTEG